MTHLAEHYSGTDMKLLVLISFVSVCIAQSIEITAPAPGTTVPTGGNFVVQISKPVTMDPSLEETLVLTMSTCEPQFPEQDCNSPSYNASLRLGDILYNGPYNPQFHEPFEAPYENFTVQAPLFTTAQMSLIATHFSLAGIGPQPFLEVKNIVLNIVNATS